MAFYDPSQEDQDPNNPQTQTGPQSGIISGQGTTGAVQSSAPSTPNAKAPDNPGNFVGIQQYLAQNKPQAANLAKDVGSYVTDQGTKAQDAISQGQSQFDSAVDQGSVKLDSNLFNEAKETPESVASDANKKAEFQKMRDATYKGPTSLETSDYYQPINLAIQNALGTAKNTESYQGRTELLNDVAKQKNQQVSRGASNLDSALLGVSPDSQNILSTARNSIAPVQDNLSAISQAEQMKAHAAADQTAKTQQAIKDAFSGATGVQGQLEQSLSQKATDAAQSSGNDANQILGLLKSGNPNLTDAQLNLLGITRNEYNGLINDQQFYKFQGQTTPLSDLSSFATVKVPQNQISAQNIASPEDYARYQALNDLMGTSNKFLSDPTQAGKANLDTIDFNFAAAPNALKDRIGAIVTQEAPFNALNDRYNLAKPGGALTAAAMALQLSPTGPNDTRPQQRADATLSSLKSAVDSINGAYGMKLKLPNSYYQAASKAITDNLQSVYDKSDHSRKMPNNVQVNQAAEITAYINFLNDLRGVPNVNNPDDPGTQNLISQQDTPPSRITGPGRQQRG